MAADVGEHLLRRAAITGVKHLSRRGRGTAGRWGLEASPRRQGRQGRLPRLGCRSLWALVLSLLGRPPDHLTPSCPARHTRRAWSALISSLQKLTPCLARRTNPVTVKPMPGEGPRLMRRPPRGVGAELPVSMVLPRPSRVSHLTLLEHSDHGKGGWLHWMAFGDSAHPGILALGGAVLTG